jgi:hypothetical protein
MKTGYDRYARFSGGLDRGGAKRSFGRNVYYIRTTLFPVRTKEPAGREAEVHFTVTGYRHPGHRDVPDRVAADGFFVSMLRRPVYLDVMAFVSETVYQSAQCHGDAIDFRCVCFGHKPYRQGVRSNATGFIIHADYRLFN